jgi:hypothetical protein
MDIGSIVRRRGGSDYYEVVRYDNLNDCWLGRIKALHGGNYSICTLPLGDFPKDWESVDVELGVVYVALDGVEFEVESWDLEVVWTYVVKGGVLFREGERIGHEWAAFEELKRCESEGYTEGYLSGETGLRWL